MTGSEEAFFTTDEGFGLRFLEDDLLLLQEEEEGLERLRQVREEEAPRDEPVTRREEEPEVHGRLTEEEVIGALLVLLPAGLGGSFFT